MLLKNLARTTFEDGIDRKTLKTLISRFLTLNSERLLRTRAALPGKQRVFLDLIPLLLHLNHPMLPGYICHSTPCGVNLYQPSKSDLLKARRLARSFTYKRQTNSDPEILSIFLMGSCGTLGQSDSSDLDFWICHSGTLSDSALNKLQQKTEKLSQWSQELGLETHFFLMDGNRFKLGQREALSGENCGSAQHYLLLDEFYRTALLLAGCPPIWWLIPAAQEDKYDHYADLLRNKRYIHEQETIDFGGIPEIPPGEFIGAGVWQLYKGIESPYKSLLKLLLLEAYASEPEPGKQLSARLKESLYSGHIDTDELDPYVMIYRRLEEYLLTKGDTVRLELVRRCLYIKAGQSLSGRASRGLPSWHRKLIETLVTEWGWSKQQIRNLDNRHLWKITAVSNERKELVNELMRSYRFLSDYARLHKVSAHIDSREMTILGRKLYAAFERKIGKIEIINPSKMFKLNEETLSFCRINSDTGDTKSYWGVFDNNSVTGNPEHDKPTESPLKISPNLLELIAWCHFNGLLDSHTHIDYREAQDGLSRFELDNIIKCLRQLDHLQTTADGNQSLGDDRFLVAAYPTQSLLLINVGIDPMAAMKEQGLTRLSDQTDSLGFSALKENLILNIEQLTINSWDEIITTRYEGKEAIVQCLKDFLQKIPPEHGASLPRLSIHCFCASRSRAIAQRVEQLFADFSACFYRGNQPPESRYILQTGDQFHVLQASRKSPTRYYANSYSALIKYLGSPQETYSPIVLDRYALQNSVLALLAAIARPGLIQVFFASRADATDLYVLDEHNALFYSCSHRDNREALFTATYRFINSVNYRKKLASGVNTQPESGQVEAEYYAIKPKNRGFKLEPWPLHSLPLTGNFFSVQVISHPGQDDDLPLSIFCGPHEFSQLELGNSLYSEVARHILKQRTAAQRYDCYITDLDLSASHSDCQTIQHLNYKQQIEQALNHALAQLD